MTLTVMALSVLASAAAPAAPGEHKAKTYTITIENVQFASTTLTVQRGDRIVWVNKDVFPHTVTSDTHAFDSKDIAPNGHWTYIARTAGTLPYHCIYHPNMTARLIVQ